MSLVQNPSNGDVLDHVALPAADVVTFVKTSTHTSIWPEQGFVRLQFESWTDLSTKLIMLPRIEEEGIGAVIANFDGNTAPRTSQQVVTEVNQSNQDQDCDDPSSCKEHRDDDGDERIEEKQSLEGLIFEGLESQKEDWREKEFTYILARLREEQDAPLILVFSVPTQSKISKQDNTTTPNLQENEPPKITEQIASSQQNSSDTKTRPPASQDSLQSSMLALSSWGMRMRAQASEAATNLSTVAKTFQVPQKDVVTPPEEPKQRSCDVFLQTSVGAFVPVSKAQSKVSTSSLLHIRRSATEAAPRLDWAYQWYRSSFAGEKSSNGVDSQSGNHPVAFDSVASMPEVATEIEWIEVEGATAASFQPDATLIGRKLRCVVSMKQSPNPGSNDDSDDGTDDSDCDQGPVQETHENCDIAGVVFADSTLFNGARQALARGASFGALKGRGNASGRQFRVEVTIGMATRKRSRKTTSALQIFQMSGQESISLTPTPILGTTAEVPSNNAKHMNLRIVVSSDSVLSALCTDGFFQLETPSRLSRESLLIALGIANYQGTPASLDTKTILFPDKSQLCLVDDESSVSSASCASSSPSQGSAQKLTRSPQSPGFFISPIQTVATPTNSLPGSPDRSLAASPEPYAVTAGGMLEEGSLIAAMEQELQFLRGKLTRKDKVVSELQRQITQSDAAHEETRHALISCQKDLEQSKKEEDRMAQSLKKAESYIDAHENKLMRIEGEHAQMISSLTNTIDAQNAKIAELERANRVLQNEKGVLKATVDARESKLTRMADLQASNEELLVKVAQVDAIRSELERSQKRYEEVSENLRKVEGVEKECQNELELARKSIGALNARVEEERTKAATSQAQVDPLQKKIQQLKGERNSYKQKNESLSKEVGRLCKNGRSIKDIEKIVIEYHSLVEEVETLRKQKKKALEEAHLYRTSYEHSKAAQILSGIEGDTQTVLERNAELSRLLVETTEYINAKEMQLETMKQVNEQLQAEIRGLAKANLGNNEI